MPWQHNGATGEGKQFLGNAREEEIAISSGQIPTSHPAGKEDIPAEEQIRLGVMDAEASRAMTGYL